MKNTSISRRDFLRFAGAAGAGIALSACTPGLNRPSGSSGEEVQLVYQDARAEWYLPMIQERLEQFHAAHPNIHVFYSPEPEGSQSKEEKMLAEMQAGTAPDVFQGCCSWFPIWAQQGYTLDLRPYVEADLDRSTIEDWDPAQYNALFTPDGLQYGLPKYHGALALYFNKDLFDRYHITYPDDSWSHDDYLQAMKQLTDDTGGPDGGKLWGSQTYISWDRIQMHINGWGGHLVDPNDPKKCLLAEKEALAAQEWIRARMWDDQVMASMLDGNNLWPDDVFLAEKIAMLEDGSWRLKHILEKANFRVGVAPFPSGPARRVTLASTDGFGIYSGTKHPEAAWELVKFLTGQEFGRAMAKAGLLQPARASIVDDWVGFIQAEYPDKTKDMNIGAFADGHRNGYSVVAEVAENMAEATRIANAAWDKIFTLGQAPVDILKEAAQQIDIAQQEKG
ncbi:MAG: sugar ABC transporter substrate-binding protein [Chloroflexi bacterium]|nr:MAG: sugar ABC transporter substrate-binding protein [Chloroflexota bacterium]